MEQDLRKDVVIEPFKVGHSELNHLRISISHDKGGVSWMTGETRPCGIRADIKPIGKHDGIISTIYDGQTEHQGFCVPLVECSRKSPKKMQLVAGKILPKAEQIKELFVSGKYEEIVTLLKTIDYTK